MTDKSKLEQVENILDSFYDRANNGESIILTYEARKILALCEPDQKAAERMTVLALKHCPAYHNDWEEIKDLSYKFVKDTVPEQPNE